MPLPHARSGVTLLVRERVLPFSFFPVTRGTRRYGLFDTLFAVSPWAVMQAAVRESVAAAGPRREAHAFLEQANDFYSAAAAPIAANPLLFYYAFLNVGKALIRTRGYVGSLDQAMHGLSARTAAGGTELRDSEIMVRDSSGVNLYSELIERLGFPRPADNTTYPVIELLPQVVIGHRLWRQGQRAKERFVAVDEVEIVNDASARLLWLRLYLVRGDLSRYEITRKRLLDEGDLADGFHEVQIGDTGRPPRLLCLEQRNPIGYTGRPTDVVMDLVEYMRPRLWRIATTLPEGAYRKYYVHLTPPAETHRVPQLASLWLLFYYFGSIVRYRPHLFDNVAAGSFGAFVTEFVSAQSEQLLYLLASEMAQREVAKPAII
jgi:YaaC-like Protein